MRMRIRGIIIIFILALGTACAPRQIKPVAVIDPSPFLHIVDERQAALEKGISGTLELTFKNSRRRFKGRVYTVALPDGQFRLEVPTPLGGTHLVMTNDNKRILAYYPDENKAFTSNVKGRSIDPHLPFPLPLDPAVLPILIMGVFPDEAGSVKSEAHLMDSGAKRLIVHEENHGLRYEFLFNEENGERLQGYTVKGEYGQILVRTEPGPPYLPADFILTTEKGTLKGEWDSITPFKGDDKALEISLPEQMPVTDLEALP